MSLPLRVQGKAILRFVRGVPGSLYHAFWYAKHCSYSRGLFRDIVDMQYCNYLDLDTWVLSYYRPRSLFRKWRAWRQHQKLVKQLQATKRTRS
jgi:hypothetical protein